MRDLLRGTTETYFDGPVPDVALVADGDLLIGISGDFNSGIWAGGAAALNQRMCRLRARPGLHQRFLRYLVDLPLRYLHDLTYSTTVKNLSIADLLDERFPCPPLEVQRTIADHLDCETARVDALIEKNQRMTELLGERRQTIITAAITGELNILGVAA
jgi:type I restriction enzyme S subunit